MIATRVMEPTFSGKEWPQYRQEIDELVAIFQRERVRSYLEVGCRYGDTLHTIGSRLPAGSKVAGIDLPGARGAYPDSGPYLTRAVQDLRNRGQDAHCFLGDSHSESAIAFARGLGPFDAVLLDGDHTPEGVRADWEHYGQAARIVAFHDICGNGRLASAVRAFWSEVREGRRWTEIVWSGRRRGIGILWN